MSNSEGLRLELFDSVLYPDHHTQVDYVNTFDIDTIINTF